VTGITTRKRSIKTSVLVDDGGILVLGGLMEENVTETESKIPLLGDIPLLGRLFKSTSTSKSKQNLMVFLHPSILRDEADAAFISSEKYNLLRSQQLLSAEDRLDQLDEEPPVIPVMKPKLIDKAQVKTDSLESEDIDWGDDEWDEG
jgi:general secretion pathway protein D